MNTEAIIKVLEIEKARKEKFLSEIEEVSPFTAQGILFEPGAIVTHNFEYLNDIGGTGFERATDEMVVVRCVKHIPTGDHYIQFEYTQPGYYEGPHYVSIKDYDKWRLVCPNLTFFCDNQGHLICIPYSKKNLHMMAYKLGIGRHFYHAKPYPHYDIPKLRVNEIINKCIVVSPKKIIEFYRKNYE